MRKASIITMHRVYNYGSVLQAYATQKIFERNGLECEILDYISPYRAKKPLFLEYPPKYNNNLAQRLLYYICKVPSFALKDFTFGKFIRQYLKLSSRSYITNDDILKNPPKADIYVTGSDQVWNSKYNHGVDSSYYLNYAPKGKKKISFVSSFGRNELVDKEASVVKPMLKEFDMISIREDSAAKILEKMGISSTVLIDPTLQLTIDEWIQMASPRLVKDDYLLLFLLYNEDNGASDYASKVAEKLGLKVVKLSWELKKSKKIDILFTHRTPQDFLSLFVNANFIVTNSFHGVAFSINLNKKFAFIPRSEFNGRIESLLRLTKLESRKVEDTDDISLCNSDIDYSKVNSILDVERARAQLYLKKALEDNHEATCEYHNPDI